MSGSEYEGHAWWRRSVFGLPEAMCPAHGRRYFLFRDLARWHVHMHSLCPFPTPAVEVGETRCKCGAHVTYDATSRLDVRCVCGRCLDDKRERAVAVLQDALDLIHLQTKGDE